MRAAPTTILLALALTAAGCASDYVDTDDEGDDPPSGASSEAVTTRWQPPSTHQTGTIEQGGPWNSGHACAGSLKAGSRALGNALKSKFAIASVDGYACRPNTANTSQLSMHGTGRALDLFVSKKAGDTVASYLAAHANELGIQLVIWKRTLWKVTPSGGSARAYNGPNPHTDHIHAELTRAAAAASKTQLDAPAPDEAQDPAPAAGDGQACANDGDCNPGNDGAGLVCEAGQCVPGCRTDAQCPGSSTCGSDGQCR